MIKWSTKCLALKLQVGLWSPLFASVACGMLLFGYTAPVEVYHTIRMCIIGAMHTFVTSFLASTFSYTTLVHVYVHEADVTSLLVIQVLC